MIIDTLWYCNINISRNNFVRLVGLVSSMTKVTCAFRGYVKKTENSTKSSIIHSTDCHLMVALKSEQDSTVWSNGVNEEILYCILTSLYSKCNKLYTSEYQAWDVLILYRDRTVHSPVHLSYWRQEIIPALIQFSLTTLWEFRHCKHCFSTLRTNIWVPRTVPQGITWTVYNKLQFLRLHSLCTAYGVTKFIYFSSFLICALAESHKGLQSPLAWKRIE